LFFFFFSSRRRHTRFSRDWSSDVCSSDLPKSIYWSAMEIVPYIILANFMLGIYTNLSVWYKLQDKTYIGAIISLIGAVATIGFNYLLIPKIGIIGAAITSLIAYSLMLLISY